MTSSIKSLSDAKSIVNLLRTNPRNLEVHQHARAACTSQSWALLVEARYPNVIVEYAESWGETDVGPSGFPAWFLSTSDTTAAFQASSTTPRSVSNTPLNIRALSTLRSLVPKLLRAIMATRTVTLVDPSTSTEGEKVEACITAASRLLFAVCHNLKVHPDETYTALLRSSGALEVAVLTWYHTPTQSTRITSSISLEFLLTPVTPSPAPSPAHSTASSLPRLTSVLTPPQIVQKSLQMLRDGIDPPGNMTVGHRLVEMCLVQWFADEGFKDGLGGWLVKRDPSTGLDMQSRVVEVVRFELESAKWGGRRDGEEEQVGELGKGKGSVMNWDLVDMSGAVLLCLVNCADIPMAMIIEFVERLELLKLISQIFVDESLGEEAQAWYNLLDLLTHCTTCIASNCHYVRTDAYINVLHASLEAGSLWANTLVRMQNLPPAGGEQRKVEGRKKRLKAWYTIGKDVGLTARLPLAPLVPVGGVGTTGAGSSSGSNGKPAEPWPRGKGAGVQRNVDGCWYEQCGRHGSVDEAIEQMLARCSGCKTARYCSKGCQKAGWVVHKGECKALKGG